MDKLFVYIALFLAWHQSPDQDIDSRGYFLKDSVKIGMPTGFAVVTRYREGTDLIFPDSTFRFDPYEYRTRKWYPTETLNGVSTDSVIYYLATFEIDSVQYFSLPFFKLTGGDSTRFSTNVDSIALIHTVNSQPDSLAAIYLREDTQYYRIPKQFNYPFATAGAIIILILGGVIWLLFGKKIGSFIRARRMLKAHNSYVEKYSEMLEALREDDLKRNSEDILIHWKKYMERLETVPYRKLTTREIASIKQEEELIRSLRYVDKAIYARAAMDKVKYELEELRGYSERKFEEKLEEVRHGVSNK